MIDEIVSICEDWVVALVEDAAESLGSYYQGRHTGTFGRLGRVQLQLQQDHHHRRRDDRDR